MADIKNFLTKQEQAEVIAAIQEAEKNTSGEIKLHLDNKCRGDVLDRAAFIFEKLEMHKTELRNGVLYYLAVEDQKFAILGDAGINAKVPDNFWESIKNHIQNLFKQNKFAQGLCEGIKMAGEQLRKHFPYQSNDVNELSDEISFGNNQ